MACRDEVEGKKAAEEVRKETENMDVYSMKLDLNSFDSIKDFVKRFKKSKKKFILSFISTASVEPRFSKLFWGIIKM